MNTRETRQWRYLYAACIVDKFRVYFTYEKNGKQYKLYFLECSNHIIELNLYARRREKGFVRVVSIQWNAMQQHRIY